MYSSEYDVCDFTLSVHPHRASWKVCLATVGIEPATFGVLVQCSANWATWSGRFETCRNNWEQAVWTHPAWFCMRVYMRVFPTFIAWSNENKSCMRVEKREFTWEFSQHSLLDQTRTRVAWVLRSESFHESFLNIHCLIKREQELYESWQARVYMRVFSTFIAWSNENKPVAWELRSESFHESFLNCHCLIKREQELHESWEARVYMRVFSTFIAWSNENKSCMRVEKRWFTWEFYQHSLLDQTRTRVAFDSSILWIGFEETILWLQHELNQDLNNLYSH